MTPALERGSRVIPGHRAETGASSVMDQLTRYRGECDGGWLLPVATSWENSSFEGQRLLVPFPRNVQY